MDAVLLTVTIIAVFCAFLIISMVLPFSLSSRMSIINWISKGAGIIYVVGGFVSVYITRNIYKMILKNDTDSISAEQNVRDIFVALFGLIMCLIVLVLRNVLNVCYRRNKALQEHLSGVDKQKRTISRSWPDY